MNLARGAQEVAVFEVGCAYRASRIGEVPGHFDGDAIKASDVAAVDEALGEQPRRVLATIEAGRHRDVLTFMERLSIPDPRNLPKLDRPLLVDPAPSGPR